MVDEARLVTALNRVDHLSVAYPHHVCAVLLLLVSQSLFADFRLQVENLPHILDNEVVFVDLLPGFEAPAFFTGLEWVDAFVLLL